MAGRLPDCGCSSGLQVPVHADVRRHLDRNVVQQAIIAVQVADCAMGRAGKVAPIVRVVAEYKARVVVDGFEPRSRNQV